MSLQHKSLVDWQSVSTIDNLQAVYRWLCQQADDRDQEVRMYQQHWSTRQWELQAILQAQQYQFQPARMVSVWTLQGQLERKPRYVFEDQLVICAIARASGETDLYHALQTAGTYIDYWEQHLPKWRQFLYFWWKKRPVLDLQQKE
ncbi:hypothetical protein [Candidatus Albibeggiatoa sp. nov. NOAA]|uniref:hypothetical protein n=1 Tax=Candidatus Albibeggiatoa sp. nov. NOAA TaxID=3162724 RepID=UPI0032F40D66|nr:hypothetical protein [Thiotrichaceae bacterium]